MTRVWKKLKSNKLNSEESGYILIMSLFVLIILFLIGTTLAVLGIQEFTLSSRTKLMDQAYAIADAGINRAAVALQMDTNLSKTVTPGPYPTAQTTAATENFGGGTFTWTLFQSETMPSNPAYKVIQSRGTISKSGRTAERTIETRIVVGAGGDEYDASFDYLFYNGNKDNPNNPPAWPDTTRLGGYVSGNYTWDGYTSFNGHAPRGAVYTKGSINVPVFFLGGIKILGNVVATDNITLSNSWGVTLTQPGISIGDRSTGIPGKIIAGLDGSGSASVRTDVTGNGVTSSMDIYGQVIAYDDVTISASVNLAFFNSALKIEGIKAGHNVSFSGSVNLSASLQLGTIVAGNKVSISSSWASGVTANAIYAGQDTGDGKGVILNTSWASSINAANVTTRGKLSATSTLASISLGTIVAGNDQAADTGGTGVEWTSSWLSGATTQSVTSTGNVLFTETVGSSYTCNGNIWSGGNVNLNAGELWLANDSIHTGNISAKGYIDIRSGDDVVVANITTEEWTSLYSSDAVQSNNVYADWNSGGGVGGYAVYIKSYAWGGLAGNHVFTYGSILARGPVYWYATAEGFGSDSQLTGGAWGTSVHLERALGVDIWDTTDAKIGKIPGYGNDSIRCGNNGSFYSQCPGWIGDAFDNDIDISGDTRMWSSAGDSVEDTDWHRVNDNSVGLPGPYPVAMPPKPNPVYVDRNGVFNEPGPQGQLKNVDVLAEANLTATIDLLKPNWDYFETMAAEDDASNPAAPHMIYDGGPGDSDGVVDGNIEFVWDTSKPYSNRETICNGEAGVALYIKALNWSNHGADFAATIVSQGDVTITAPNTDWFMNTSQMLNVVAGHDITATTAGLTLWETANCQYHFWADHNIDLTNMRFSLGGSQTYFGSFTAGNRVYMADNSFWPNSTFRWTRWALDPVAWAPPFQVLTWKEI